MSATKVVEDNPVQRIHDVAVQWTVLACRDSDLTPEQFLEKYDEAFNRMMARAGSLKR